MSEYGRLMEKIAQELNIKKETGEDSITWKARVVYSVMGKMALASLFDVLENDQSVSIIHFKNRIQKMMHSYMELYPELKNVMQASEEEFSEEIYNIYRQTGYFYHTPNRLLPSAEVRVKDAHIELVRGTALSEKTCISGLGTYLITGLNVNNIESVFHMFQIPIQDLKSTLHGILKRVSWNDFDNDLHREYLRLNPPFTRGYWKSEPDCEGEVSLLRVISNSVMLYYLYKFENDKIVVSELPTWMVEGNQYRFISNCILAEKGTLPMVDVERKQHFVYITQNYLLPPALFYFMKLYSWPLSFYSVPSDFKRVMQKDVFEVFERLLQIIGIEVNG